jgi:archaemetzincin
MNPRSAYDKKRCQYNSKLLLGHLVNCCPQDVLSFIGLTSLDLYIPILKYVYGLAQMEGRCCIVSLHRLDPQFYGLPPNPELYRLRAEKTVLHELGHCLGLTHCRNRSCVMYSSTTIAHTDHKKADFCPTCLELFKWHLEKRLACV